VLKTVHLLDDVALGGVTVALKNFQDLRLQKIAQIDTRTVSPQNSIAPKIQADIIIIHFTMAWNKLLFLASLRVRNPNVRVILVEHSYTKGFERYNVKWHLRFRQMLRIAYALCDQVVAVSEGQAKWLSSFCLRRNLKVISQSRPLKEFDQLALTEYSKSRPVIFGAIGRFHRQKGFDNLITAFRAAAMENAKLRIAGYGDDEDKLRALTAGDSNIEFVGKVSDAASFYQSVDVVAIPSRWEAFGLVASEAMAAGKFVIAADTDGLPEQLLGHGLI